MRWNENHLHLRPQIPNHKLDAIFAFAATLGVECKITRAGLEVSTVESRGFNPSHQARISAWIRNGTLLTEEPVHATHFGGLARTRFTV